MDSTLIEDALRGAMADGNEQAASELRQMLGAARERERAEKLLESEGVLGRTAIGIGRGAANVRDAIGGLFGAKPLVEKGGAADTALMDTTSGQVGNFIGESLATAPIGGVAGAAAKGVGGRVLGRTLGKLAGMAAEGAAPAALMADPESRGTSALVGGGIGIAAPTVMKGVGKVLKRAVTGAFRPAAGSEAAALMAKGVPITPGQAQPGWRPVEDLAASGLFGNRAREGREIAEQAARHSGIDIGDLAGTSTKHIEDIPERLAAQKGNLSQAYEDLLQGQKLFPSLRPGGAGTPKKRIDKALAEIVNGVEGASRAEKSVALGIIEDELTRGPGLKSAVAKTGALKRIDASELNGLRSALKKGAAAARQKNESNISEMLELAAASVDDAIEEQLPQVGQEIGALRKAYSANARISEASGAALTEHGQFTPRQLRQSAVKGHSKANVGRGAGHPELLGLSDQMQEVFRTGADTGQKNVAMEVLKGLGKVGGAVGGGAVVGGVPGAGLAAAVPTAASIISKGLPRALAVGQTGWQTRLAGKTLTPQSVKRLGRPLTTAAARIAALRKEDSTGEEY